MGLIESIKKNWAAIMVIGGIVGATFYMISTLDARAAEVAKKEVQATINKEMVDGAKKAAKEAVQDAMAEQKEEIKKAVKEAAKEAAKEVVKQQKEANK
jgi:F0F1-type ATP synthase membrane subunit b/b'